MYFKITPKVHEVSLFLEENIKKHIFYTA